MTKRLSWLPPVSEISSYFSPRLFSFSSITGFLPCFVRIGPCCFTFCEQRTGDQTPRRTLKDSRALPKHVTSQSLEEACPMFSPPRDSTGARSAAAQHPAAPRHRPTRRGGPTAPLRPRSPRGSDRREEKRRWASRRFLPREEERRRPVSVPFPLPIRLLSRILCLPLLWANPYLATPRGRSGGEEVTQQLSPPRTPPGGKSSRRLLRNPLTNSARALGIPRTPPA